MSSLKPTLSNIPQEEEKGPSLLTEIFNIEEAIDELCNMPYIKLVIAKRDSRSGGYDIDKLRAMAKYLKISRDQNKGSLIDAIRAKRNPSLDIILDSNNMQSTLNEHSVSHSSGSYVYDSHSSSHNLLDHSVDHDSIHQDIESSHSINPSLPTTFVSTFPSSSSSSSSLSISKQEDASKLSKHVENKTGNGKRPNDSIQTTSNKRVIDLRESNNNNNSSSSSIEKEGLETQFVVSQMIRIKYDLITSLDRDLRSSLKDCVYPHSSSHYTLLEEIYESEVNEIKELIKKRSRLHGIS